VGGWDQNGSQGDWLGGVDWIRLAQDRERWRDVVSVVMNLRVLAPRKWLVNNPLDEVKHRDLLLQVSLFATQRGQALV
jgi:hypothetical protein